MGLFVFLFSFVATVFAADLRAPFDFESTAVLPKGVRNPRFKNLIMFMDEKFGPSGGVEKLGYKLNKNVTWRDVIDGQDDADLKKIVQGKVEDLGYSLDGTAGSTSGVVNTYANVKVPVFAMGVTEKLTMAVAVPVVDVDINADTGFQKSEAGDAFVRDLCQTNKVQCNEAADKLNNAINSKLKRLGYEPIKSHRVSNIGDVKVVGKYLLAQRRNDEITVKAEVTLPTGTPPNANKALDVPTGDGQTDLGGMVIYDRFLDKSRLVRANLYAGYTVQMPDHIEKRIPISETDTLSADKELLKRDLGDLVSVGTAFVYEFPFGVNLGAAYGFQYLKKSRYKGDRLPGYRYSLLELDTAQRLHSATLGIGFSSVEMYRAHRFVAPFQVNFAYCKPLAGLNVAKNDFMAFEVVLFF